MKRQDVHFLLPESFEKSHVLLTVYVHEGVN